MNTEMQRHLIAPLMRGLLVCLLGYSGFAVAGDITAVEPNESISTAQSTPVPTEGLTISARMGYVDGDLSTDLDYFTFDATQGDTPSIAIVDAANLDGNGECLGFPSNLALYDALGNQLAGGMANCYETGMVEARIDGTTLSATGRYIVAVGAWSHTFTGNEVDNADVATPGGTYKLLISGVRNPTSAPPPPPPPSTSAKHVPIEVRHWHQDERDLGRRRGMWPITVAILSMADFDATKVDPSSLTFGATGSEKSLFRCRKHGKDINRDRHIDTVCYFKPDVANFQTGDLNGVLKGKTLSGQKIEGSAALKIYSVPTERRGFKHRHAGHKQRYGYNSHNGHKQR